MVKQFTIPCQFQQTTSPVTLYIGHPEFTHHPVHFQSEWLSSTKGGTIPQDLMDTLQTLHDLANQNGADFEELCYYALISATQHNVGAGVSKDDINKYAQEYVQSDGQVAQQIAEPNKTAKDNSKTDDAAEPPKATEEQNNQKTSNTEQTNQSNPPKEQIERKADEKESTNQPNQPEPAAEQTEKKITPSIQKPVEKDLKNKQEETQAAKAEDSLIGDTQTVSKKEEQHNKDVLEQLGKIGDNTNNANNNNIGTINMNPTPTATTVAKSSIGEAVYTQEDEDLLLEDDMTTMQGEERAKEVEKMITDTMNEIMAKQEQRAAEEKAKNSTNGPNAINTETNASMTNPDTSDAKDNPIGDTNSSTKNNPTSSIYSSDDDELLG